MVEARSDVVDEVPDDDERELVSSAVTGGDETPNTSPRNASANPVGGPRRPLLPSTETGRENEEVVPVKAVSTWVLPSRVTVGR